MVLQPPLCQIGRPFSVLFPAPQSQEKPIFPAPWSFLQAASPDMSGEAMALVQTSRPWHQSQPVVQASSGHRGQHRVADSGSQCLRVLPSLPRVLGFCPPQLHGEGAAFLEESVTFQPGALAGGVPAAVWSRVAAGHVSSTVLERSRGVRNAWLKGASSLPGCVSPNAPRGREGEGSLFPPSLCKRRTRQSAGKQARKPGRDGCLQSASFEVPSSVPLSHRRSLRSSVAVGIARLWLAHLVATGAQL